MAEDLQQENAKFVVTSRGLEPARRVRSALRHATHGARVRGTGFRGIFVLEAHGDGAELANLVWRDCAQNIGHVTVILASVESREGPIKEAAVRIGAAQIGGAESFCFRLRKRGDHGLDKATSALEPEIGAAIWTALAAKHNKKPRVSLSDPEITVVAEIFGAVADIGIWRRAWREPVRLIEEASEQSRRLGENRSRNPCE